MIASVTVSATTICSKLIVQRKTSYKSNVIYQKWFGTEDGKPSEYNRNAAKKRVPYLHSQKFLSTSHMNALEELSLSVLRVGASEAMVPATQGMKCLHRKTQLFPLLMPLLVFVWVGGSGVNAPEIGWSQMAPLFKEVFPHLIWQGETGDCKTTAKNLTLIANRLVTHSSSVLKNIYLPYYVWPHPIKLLTTV